VVKKFALYFDVEPRIVPIYKNTQYMMDAKEAMQYIDDNTICVFSILGSTFTGHFEKVRLLNDELDKLQQEKGLDVDIHVDAASGGFVAPFAFPQLEWDFRVPRVKSINVSGHKYGLVYPGIGWILWRDEQELPQDLIFHLDYLGGDEPTFNLNFSRSSQGVLGQYYNFLRLGREGYSDVITSCMEGAKFLSSMIKDTDYFEILSESHKKGHEGLPLVCISLKTPTEGRLNFDEYDIMHTLRQRGWVVPAYKLPRDEEDKAILRIVIREIHTKSIIDKLITDLVWAYESLCSRHGIDTPPHIEKTEPKQWKEAMEGRAKTSNETFSSVC